MEQYELSENPTIESIEHLTSMEALGKLSMDFGGKRLYIPHKCGEHSPLAASIGIAYAQKICDAYGGLYWAVPATIGQKIRVIKLYQQGMSTYAIAMKLRCSDRYVKRVLSKIPKNQDNQLSLF